MSNVGRQAIHWSALLLVPFLVMGCATNAKRVDCGGRLEPINAPAPAATPASPQQDPVP